MSRVTMNRMTRWLAAVLVSLVALHGTANAQAFKKKPTKPAAATRAKKTPAKKTTAKKATKRKKSHVAASSRADDLTPDADDEDAKPAKVAKGGRGKKVKQLAPEEEDDYIVIEDDDEDE